MDENENPDVRALKALCLREGGYAVVAKAIGSNDQSIYQIITGVKLKSGRPKGVGPSLRDKLNKRYPGWNSEQNFLDPHSAELNSILVTIGASFRSIPQDQWAAALVDVSVALAKRHRF